MAKVDGNLFENIYGKVVTCWDIYFGLVYLPSLHIH